MNLRIRRRYRESYPTILPACGGGQLIGAVAPPAARHANGKVQHFHAHSDLACPLLTNQAAVAELFSINPAVVHEGAERLSRGGGGGGGGGECHAEVRVKGGLGRVVTCPLGSIL